MCSDVPPSMMLFQATIVSFATSSKCDLILQTLYEWVKTGDASVTVLNREVTISDEVVTVAQSSKLSCLSIQNPELNHKDSNTIIISSL